MQKYGFVFYSLYPSISAKAMPVMQVLPNEREDTNIVQISTFRKNRTPKTHFSLREECVSWARQGK